MKDLKCPKCGNPLKNILSTYYCLGCRITVDPTLLVPRPMTMSNGDRIRAMTNQELAEFLCEVCGCYVDNCPGATMCVPGDGKANGLKKWLEQPSEEEP